MANRIWYKKKRFWALIVILGWLFISRMEFLKLRYHKKEFANAISVVHGVKTFYASKTLDGRSMNFIKLMGAPDKPLLVLVHGSPGSLQAYNAFLKDPDIFEHFDMIAVDRPGFGYSDFGTYESSLSIQAGLLAAVLEDFPKRKKILIGHSMGGPVIAKTAMDFPERVNGMIMIAASISAELEPSDGWRKFLDFPVFRWLTPPAMRVCNQEIIPLKEELKELESSWKKIIVPVTFIHGTEDPLVPHGNSDYGNEMLVNSPQVKIKKLEDKDHFILWSEIPEIKAEIFSLMESLN